MLWRIDSAIGHTVSRDANSQARVHQVWTLERTGLRFRSDAFACVWMEVNGAVWPRLKNITSETLT